MKLNPMQMEAIHHTQGPLLILAGAGSGKTTVLAYRTNYLLDSHVTPGSIMCITFTNKAAEQLKKRIQRDDVWVSTFHALGLHFLREHLPFEFKVAHTNQAKQIVKAISESFSPEKEETKEFLKPANLCKLIALMKNELATADFFTSSCPLAVHIDKEKIKQIIVSEMGSKEHYELFKKVYAEYQQRLARFGLIDVDDILVESVKLLTTKGPLLTHYQKMIQYLMVDEYQDTNRAQYILVRLLAAHHRNLAVVGDDFQSIYAFRGSDIRNILSFDKDYPEAKVIKLEENYRSTKIIVEAANQIISNNKEQKEKLLFTSNETGEKIKFHRAHLNLDEAKFVAGQIKALIEKGYEYRDIAIFYRSHSDSAVFETVFPGEHIPFLVAAESSFFERKEIKDILSYLSFIQDSTNSYALRAIINTPKRGIGATTIDKVLEQVTDKQFLSFMKHPVGIDRLNGKTKEGLLSFAALIEKYQLLSSSLPVADVIEQLIEESGYRTLFDDLEHYVKREKEAYLQKLIHLAREMNPKSLSDFLKNLYKTDVDSELKEEEFNCVQLLTIHSAKGLEFPVVFIVGMKEEGFPSRYAASERQIEEERRLCYVAFTRAKEKLFLTFPAKQMEKIDKDTVIERDNTESRFLREFDKELLEEIS